MLLFWEFVLQVYHAMFSSLTINVLKVAVTKDLVAVVSSRSPMNMSNLLSEEYSYPFSVLLLYMFMLILQR